MLGIGVVYHTRSTPQSMPLAMYLYYTDLRYFYRVYRVNN